MVTKYYVPLIMTFNSASNLVSELDFFFGQCFRLIFCGLRAEQNGIPSGAHPWNEKGFKSLGIWGRSFFYKRVNISLVWATHTTPVLIRAYLRAQVMENVGLANLFFSSCHFRNRERIVRVNGNSLNLVLLFGIINLNIEHSIKAHLINFVRKHCRVRRRINRIIANSIRTQRRERTVSVKANVNTKSF